MAKTPNQKYVTRKHMARLERERIQQRYLLIAVTAVGVLIVGLILFGLLDQTVLTRTRPVARVGSEVISTGEFQTQVRYTRVRMIEQLNYLASDQMMAQFFGSYIQQIATQLNSPNQLGQEVLDRIIEDKIIAQEAGKLGISVSDEEVDQALEEFFGYFANGTPTPSVTPPPFSTATLSATQLALVPPTATPTETPLPTEGAATATLAASPTPTLELTATPDYTATPAPTPTEYTREGYEALSKDFLDGLKEINFSQAELRELIKSQLLREKVTAEITKDVKADAEQVWARHILVATEEEANAVRERLLAGEEFAKVAAEVSTDESNKDQGGDLQWFTREKMVAPFSEAAFNLHVGEISQPVSTDFGFHIIQVIAHEVRPLSAEELQQAKDTAFSSWIDTKRTELQVETFDRWLQVVPSDPAIPAQLQQLISTMGTQPSTFP
jgi:peptidyl-prolyl cis-trans isomerase D